MTSPALQPSFTWGQIEQSRNSNMWKIHAFFEANLGKKFSSRWLHGQWGSSFRSRVSDINSPEKCPDARIEIKNEMSWNDLVGREESCYFAEAKCPTERL